MAITEKTHSPLPWSLEVFGNTLRVVHTVEHVGQRTYGDDVAILGDARDQGNQADAALIVRAVNAHADLVEALRSLRNEASGFLALANVQDHGETNMRCLQRRIDAADAVLAKATGGA